MLIPMECREITRMRIAIFTRLSFPSPAREPGCEASLNVVFVLLLRSLLTTFGMDTSLKLTRLHFQAGDDVLLFLEVVAAEHLFVRGSTWSRFEDNFSPSNHWYHHFLFPCGGSRN